MNDPDQHDGRLLPTFDNPPNMPVIRERTDRFRQGAAPQSARYAAPVHQRRTVNSGPVLAGQGRLSARLYLKQANASLQARLTYAVKPWLTLALTHGKVEFPDNMRAMLDYCWRLLLKNQSRSTLGGSSLDTVHTENDLRNLNLSDMSARLITDALHALPGSPVPLETTSRTARRPAPHSANSETYVVVWNPHGWQVRQVIKLPVPTARRRNTRPR